MKRKPSSSSSTNESKSAIVYVIECVTCGKRVERSALDLTLGKHQDPKTGYTCYGNGALKEIKVIP